MCIRDSSDVDRLELVGEGVVARWDVGRAAQRAVVRELEQHRLVDLDDDALVLVRSALPLAAEGDGATWPPVRQDLRAEHVLAHALRVEENLPDPLRRRRDLRGGDLSLIHISEPTRL